MPVVKFIREISALKLIKKMSVVLVRKMPIMTNANFFRQSFKVYSAKGIYISCIEVM